MRSRNRLARVAGAALLAICASGLLSNNLVIAGNALGTVHAIAAHERLFRTGVFGETIMLSGDVVLAVAFYRLLAPFGAGLALAGSVWRLANAMMLALGVVTELVAVDVVCDPQLSTLLGSAQVPSMLETLLDMHGTATEVGLIFFGLGAAIHAWLLSLSRYVPRPLAGAYLVLASAIAIFCGALIIFPSLVRIVSPWIIGPDFAIELLVALWLLINGASDDTVRSDGSLPESRLS